MWRVWVVRHEGERGAVHVVPGSVRIAWGDSSEQPTALAQVDVAHTLDYIRRRFGYYRFHVEWNAE